MPLFKGRQGRDFRRNIQEKLKNGGVKPLLPFSTVVSTSYNDSNKVFNV